MNKIPLKITFVTLLLPAVLTHAGLTSAASLKGSLGVNSGATDFYRVTCSTNSNGATDNLAVTLLDRAPVAAPMISVQVVKGILAKNTTDAVDGNTAYSPAAIVKGGNGIYDVRVNKTATGVDLYALNYNCLNRVGKITGTVISTVQNK